MLSHCCTVSSRSSFLSPAAPSIHTKLHARSTNIFLFYCCSFLLLCYRLRTVAFSVSIILATVLRERYRESALRRHYFHQYNMQSWQSTYSLNTSAANPLSVVRQEHAPTKTIIIIQRGVLDQTDRDLGKCSLL